MTKHPENSKMALVNPYLSIITVNINILNSLVKSHRVARQIKIHDQTISNLSETHFSVKNTNWLKVKLQKKIFHTCGNQKKAGVARAITENIDFKPKAATRKKIRSLYNVVNSSRRQQS